MPCATGTVTAAPRFNIGDIVEVFGTGIGLRAWQNTCTGSYVVKPDNTIGIIQGAAQCCGGYVRWKIRYSGDTVDRWSAEGDPDTGDFWLWKITSTYTVSGTVTHNGNGLSGVVMQGLPGNPATDANGNYSALVAAVSAYTVTPTKSGYLFSPPSRTYATINADQANQNFTATAITNSYTIRGDLTIGQSPFSGSVSMNVAPSVPGSPFNASEDYDVVVPAGWSGTITPVADGYTFSPSSRSYSNVTSNDSNEDYAASVIGPGDTTLTVNLAPQDAVNDGGGWLLWYYRDGSWRGHELNYRPSGDTAYLDSQNADTFVVQFKYLDSDGWNNPPEQTIPYVPGSTQTVTATYTKMSGAVTTTIGPPEANSAGAQWRVAAGPWRDSGFTEQAVLAGFQVVEFKPVAGWLHPANRTISVGNYGSVSLADTYINQGTEPLIVSVSPSSGPLEGGSEVTISGANFAEPASVTFGGVPATQTTVISDTEIRAKSPARPTIGSVDVGVTIGGETATKSNAFSYLAGVGHGMRLVGQVGGSSRAVAAQGNYVYVNVGPSLVVLDVSNPSAPSRVGSILLDGYVNGITVSGTRAYVSAGDRGVYIVEITNPTLPAVIGVYNTPGLAFSAQELGGILYVADFSEGLVILDISNPAVPSLVGSIGNFGNAYRLELKVDTNGLFAYVTTYTSSGLQVIDVSDPKAPALRGAYTFPTYAAGLDVIGALAYVACWNGTFYVLDVSNPDAPSMVGQSPPVLLMQDVAVVGNRAYTTGGDLHVWEVSDPTNPVRVNNNFFDLFGAPRLAISGNIAYVADSDTGLKVISVTNVPVTQLGQFSSESMYVSVVAATNGVAYVGELNYGLRVIDTSNPQRPFIQGALSWPEDGISDGIVYSYNHVYMASQCSGLNAVNVNPPNMPTLTFNSYDDDDGDVCYRDVVVAGGRLYASAFQIAQFPGTAQLRIFGLNSPPTPALLGTANLGTTQSYIGDIAVVLPWAYVAADELGMRVVDVSNPASPIPRGIYSIPGDRAESVAVANGRGYVTMNSGYVHVVDVTNPDNPVYVSEWQVAGQSQIGLTIEDGLLFLAASGAGVEVRDPAANPDAPPVVANYDTASSARSISVVGELVFVADGHGGMAILELLDFRPPTVFITNPFSPTYTTSANTINLGGAASDDRGVDRVEWINHRGGSGTAIGTNSWTVGSIPLQPGQNIITVTGYDEEGNAGSDVITVTYNAPPDVEPPTVIISSPTQGESYMTSASSMDLAGTASDDREVTQVTWTNDRGGAGNSTGTTNWNISDVPLRTGENVLSVMAYDAANNAGTATLTVTVSDADGDGVADDDDACPNTIPGVPVDSSGCPPFIPGDLDRDGDVDLGEFSRVVGCLSGPGAGLGELGCADSDLNGDGDIDLLDIASVQRCFSGTNVPADCRD